jgi:hypothetical protein
MKYILIVLFSLTTFLGFGQSVTAPEPKSFTVNTTAQDASGFSLSGFSSTATLLTSISLVNPPSGTTFYFNTTTGLTAASGFTLTGNKTRLVVTGTMANINTALASLKVNTGATAGNVQISVAATVNPTGYYYNGVNGHFYRPISTGNTYTGARAAALNTTFKGQTGYLVTITSADEDAFIFTNVPQNSIWFALTDELSEGQWRIDAGPEAGTLIKTANGQLNGNVQGQYNNWAGGEPNNSGNEDYAVTKWGGGSQWNDLPNNFSCPYVIEYGTWADPDNATFTEFYTNSVSHSNGNTLRSQFTFSFGSNVDETIFKTRILTSIDNTTFSSNNSYVNLNGIGRVDMTQQMDTSQIIGNGNKATINPGQAEYSYVNPNASWLNGDSRLLIDMRTFGNTTPSSISSVKILDCYDGPVTFLNSDASWAQYRVPSPLTKVTDGTSIYNTNIRNVNGWNTDYAFTSNISFAQNTMNKYHKITFGNLTTTQNQSLLGSMLTVGDVYLAFKEYSDRGILGDESRYFTSGIQFHNADVNEDGQFDERDCYSLLTHLQGTTSLWQSSPSIYDAMKIIPSSIYDNITKQNWSTYTSIKRIEYPFTFTNGILNSYNLDISWKGDVNLSHSSQPTGFIPSSANGDVSQIKSMSISTNSVGDVEAEILMEKIEGNIVATIIVNSNGNSIGATQFDVYYDNSILDFSKVEFNNVQSTNFGRNNGSFVSLGSLSTSGGSISNIGYKVIFKPKSTVTNLLGLISIKSVETLNTSLNKINVKVL